MSIAIPDRKQIRITTDFLTPNNGQALPAMLADTAMTNPGPIAVSPSGATSDARAQAQCTPASGSAGDGGYIGFNPTPNIALGGPVSVVRGVVVDGFSGVTPGSPVFVDPTNNADHTSTSSGLTHTQPAGAGVVTPSVELDAGSVSATSTIEIVVPVGATALQYLDLTTNANAAADDTNYWTESLTNKGTAGTGSTVMLLATDVNTSKATGGNGGFAAGVPTPSTLSSTTANLSVSAGQVLALTLTKASAAPNLTDLTIRAAFTGTPGGLASKVGVGWSSTKIFFL